VSKKDKKVEPPSWAVRFLNWYCRPELLEDLQGDLNEYFERNLKSKGLRLARLIFVIDVFKFLRTYTLKTPEVLNLLINWIMLGSYIKTSGRTIVRNKLFSSINIIGLSISMSVGLLLIGVLVDLYSYDKFHEHHSHIYRVISRHQYLDNKGNNFMATASLRAGKAIKETFPGVEEVAILRNGFEGDIVFGEKTLPLSGFWADESLFKVFTFPLLKGDPATALKMPFSLVLTETSARKIFGDQDAVGKSVVLNNDKAYTITGIMKDIPHFSHMHFDMLGSLSTRDVIEPNNNDLAWDNMWTSWVYLLIPEGASRDAFQENLNRLSAKEDPAVKNTHIELALQPLNNIMMGDRLGNQIGGTMGRTLVLVFSALSFVVLISACFNYTNLSVARSLRRSREVGIRKVIGALRIHVIGQFVVEAVIISLLSLITAFLIFLFLKPHFLNMHSDMRDLLVLDLSPMMIVSFVVFAVLVGIAAGFFPALFFAKINAIQVLKDVSSVRVFRKLTMRKVLIVFQYCLSLMLIIATFIIYEQYKHYLAFDLGFSTDKILNIRLQGNKAAILKKELGELPEVKAISESGMIMSVGSAWGAMIRNPKNTEDSAFVFSNHVDENYIPLHNLQLLAGKNFTPKGENVEESEVIVNQQVLKRFNVADQVPAQAIGEVLKVNGKELRIIGVMKDIQYNQANSMNVNELMLRHSKDAIYFLNVKIESGDLTAAYDKIESRWKKIDGGVHPFEAKFYDDQIKQSFSGLSASMKLTGFIAFLAICIATMGLLGMVVFTTETRLKEISIRKVLGASEGKLIYLLGKGFIVLLGIAAGIALPVTYLFFDRVMFPELPNHAPLNLTDGMIGVLSVMAIAILMIASQTFKVAQTNPAEVLKNE
jgi:ABC-type antimicrobial peptide transport system permease subunit